MGSRYLVSIISNTDEDYSIAVRGSRIAVVVRDPHDPSQNWFKDETYGKTKRDVEGQPAFALINEATDEAIMLDSRFQCLFAKHCNQSEEPTLWTSKNTDEEAHSTCIRLMHDPFRVFTVVQDIIYGGSVIHLSTAAGDHQNYQNWRIVQHKVPVQLRRTPSMDLSDQRPAVTISCRIREGYNLTICNNVVMVAPSNYGDRRQLWIKKTLYARQAKDEENKQAFALVNKATGQAIDHGNGQVVRLVQFNPFHVAESILWTESGDVHDGFRYIRIINNDTRVLDLFHGHIGYVLPWLHSFIDGHHWQHWKIEETK